MSRNFFFIRVDEVTGDLPCPPLVAADVGRDVQIVKAGYGGIRRRAA